MYNHTDGGTQYASIYIYIHRRFRAGVDKSAANCYNYNEENYFPQGEERMKHVDIYTDGACSGNPGPGGYGAILVFKGLEREISGGSPETTNNRMELLGAITALELLKEPCNVILTSDSKYLVDGINLGWAKSWKKNNWTKADKKPALNADLWGRLLELLEVHDVTFVWVKGHAGHPYNERCDELAVAAINAIKSSIKI